VSQPLVSIIIPTYNRAHLIGETLDSVLAQTYANWECIVVDDGSSDNTDEVLKTYCNKDARFKYVHRPDTHKPGGNGARNYGFEVSKGEYLIFLDSDDLLEKECLSTRVSSIEHNSSHLCIYSMGLYINRKKSQTIFNKDYESEKEYLQKFLSGIAPWTITCVFWPRNIFQKIGMFDDKFLRLQDLDLHTRLLIFNFKIKRVFLIDSWYRVLDNLEDYFSEERLPIITESKSKYIEKFWNFDNQIISKNELRNSLRYLYLNSLKKEVFRLAQTISYNKVYIINKRLHILSFKKTIVFILLEKYHRLGFFQKFGYFKLRQILFKES